MIDRNRPHYHVMLAEDDQYIASFRTPAEARSLQRELRRGGWRPFVEKCGNNCPLLFDRPFDAPSGSSKETR